MLSIRYRSIVFKFFLTGLLAVLVASYSVDAAPTGKSLAKAPKKATAPAKASAPAKAAVPTKALAPVKAARPAKATRPRKGPPAKAPTGKGTAGKQCLLGPSKNALRKRAVISHPDAKSPVVLFHGTHKESSSLQKPELSKTHSLGDLHSEGVCGGFYLTDSIIAAAQFVCHREGFYKIGKEPTTAYVHSYQWTPPSNFDSDIHSYPDGTPHKDLENDICKSYKMVTAPMNDPDTDKPLTKDFRQYAIVQQDLLDNNLKHLGRYIIPCARVHKGKDLPAEEYKKGQASNPDFETYAHQLVNGCDKK